MTYSVGDLVLMKWFHHGKYGHLIDTLGVVTAINCFAFLYGEEDCRHEDKFAWLSQIDGKEYYFYEWEIEGEILKL